MYKNHKDYFEFLVYLQVLVNRYSYAKSRTTFSSGTALTRYRLLNVHAPIHLSWQSQILSDMRIRYAANKLYGDCHEIVTKCDLFFIFRLATINHGSNCRISCTESQLV